MESLGLYIHVPFCSAICNYCNFNRGLFDAGLKARYVDALVTEIHQAGLPPSPKGFGEPRRSSPVLSASRGGQACTTNVAGVVQTFRSAVDTIDPGAVQSSRSALATRAAADTSFFGGGTPSLLEPEEIARVIAACRSVVDLAPDAEITLEANPETVTTERLAAYRSA